MNTIRARAKEQLPQVLLTLMSIIQALALEFLWDDVRVAERARELATLRVLGFSRGEVGAVLVGELVLLTLAAGMVLGLLIGQINVPVGKFSVGLGNAGGLLLSGIFVSSVVSRLRFFGSTPNVARNILGQRAFEPFNAGETSPGPSVSTDQEILDWVAKDGETALHPSCTCRMGTDEMSVVDPLTMKVHGVEGVRVCDASAMPYVTNGNIYWNLKKN